MLKSDIKSFPSATDPLYFQARCAPECGALCETLLRGPTQWCV